MDADNPAALRALPSIHLSGNKFLDPKLADILQILYHAHAIVRSVAFVQMPQAKAGEFGAIKTKLVSRNPCLAAGFYATDNTMLWFAGISAIAAWTRVFISEMANTKTAIHPT